MLVAPPMISDPELDMIVMSFKPYFACVLFAQLLVAILTLSILGDVWGAFTSMCIVSIGIMAVKERMDMQIITCYGIMCLVDGMVDILQMMDPAMMEALIKDNHVRPDTLPAAVLLLQPFATFSGCFMAGMMYRSYSEILFEYEIATAGYDFPFPMPPELDAAEYARSSSSRSNHRNLVSSFIPFSGHAHRIMKGDDPSKGGSASRNLHSASIVSGEDTKAETDDERDQMTPVKVMIDCSTSPQKHSEEETTSSD